MAHEQGVGGSTFSGEDLVAAMDAAARHLLQWGGEEEAAEQIVSSAISAIPMVDQAGISLVETDLTVVSQAPSSATVWELDQLQNELGEGPCLEAIHHFERALTSRDEIGQAKGILMKRFSLAPDEAFTLLTRCSQDTDIKLRDVAHWLVTQVSARSGSANGTGQD